MPGRRPSKKTDNIVNSNPAALREVARQASRAAVTEFMEGPGLQRLVDQAVAKGVGDALTRLGFQMDKPDAMQENLRHLGAWVDTMKIIRTRGIGAIVVGIVGIVFTALGFGISHMLSAKP